MKKTIWIASLAALVAVAAVALGDGGQLTPGGLAKVTHDATMSGNGTVAVPLGVNTSSGGVQARVTGSCSTPNAIDVVNSDGTVTCSTGVLNTSNVSGTSTTIPKFTGANTIGNSSITDNSTTVTTTEAFTANGTCTLGDASHDASTGRDFTVGRNGTVTGTLLVSGLETVSQQIQVNSSSGALVSPKIDSYSTSPNGVLTRPEGSVVMDTGDGAIWVNTNSGTVWSQILNGGSTGTASCAQMPTFTGDVTSAGGTCALSIATNAVVTNDIAANAATNAKLAQAAALTVKGNATNATANVTDIASSSAGQFFARTGSSTLAWQVPAFAAKYFGPGADGSITFDGSTTVLGMVPASNIYTMTRDITPTSMTVNTGIEVKTAGFRVFVKGTLTNNGKIDDNGKSATTAANATCRSAGIFPAAIGPGSPSGTIPFPYCLTLAALTQGQNGGKCQAGAGGNGTNPGGSNGALTQTTLVQGATLIDDMMNARVSSGAGTALTNTTSGSIGGTGAGCTNGGGGCGGAWVYVGAYVMTGTGTIEGKGGDGFTGSAGGNCGGGGGGAGGFVEMVYITRSGNVCSVTGGNGGAALGTGTAGGNGGSGDCETYNLSGDGT